MTFERRLQRYLRGSAAHGREPVSAGPFTAYFDGTDPLSYFDYAIPDEETAPTAEDAAAGVFTAPADGLSELAGIGTVPAFRRRGIAAALTAALAAEAFARGVELAFLTPGDDDTRRVYERAGFEATSTVLAYARGS